MKCRILKKGNKFYAQYYDRKLFPGRHTRSAYVWCSLKNKTYDQRASCGFYETDCFDSEKEAERALIQYAESHSEGTVVKEFEAQLKKFPNLNRVDTKKGLVRNVRP